MKKLKKHIIKLVLALFLVSGLGVLPIEAGFLTKSSELNGYSLVGLHVVNVTFHASGYSTANTGSVTNMYFTDWAWFPNTISSHVTWKSSIPKGQKANGTVRIGVGVNSPWGAVNLWGGQHYFGLYF